MRRIEQVEEFQPELSLNSLGHFEVLVQAKVHVADARTGADAGPGITDLPELIPIHGVYTWVEPLSGVARVRAARLARDTIGAFAPGCPSTANSHGIANRAGSAKTHESGDGRPAGHANDGREFPT